MVPASTSCAPHHNTPTMLAEMKKITAPVSQARDWVEVRAAS
jgi:hypothetical protein